MSQPYPCAVACNVPPPPPPPPYSNCDCECSDAEGIVDRRITRIKFTIAGVPDTLVRWEREGDGSWAKYIKTGLSACNKEYVVVRDPDTCLWQVLMETIPLPGGIIEYYFANGDADGCPYPEDDPDNGQPYATLGGSVGDLQLEFDVSTRTIKFDLWATPSTIAPVDELWSVCDQVTDLAGTVPGPDRPTWDGAACTNTGHAINATAEISEEQICEDCREDGVTVNFTATFSGRQGKDDSCFSTEAEANAACSTGLDDFVVELSGSGHEFECLAISSNLADDRPILYEEPRASLGAVFDTGRCTNPGEGWAPYCNHQTTYSKLYYPEGADRIRISTSSDTMWITVDEYDITPDGDGLPTYGHTRFRLKYVSDVSFVAANTSLTVADFEVVSVEYIGNDANPTVLTAGTKAIAIDIEVLESP